MHRSVILTMENSKIWDFSLKISHLTFLGRFVMDLNLLLLKQVFPHDQISLSTQLDEYPNFGFNSDKGF